MSGRRTQAERTATAEARMIRAAGKLIATQGYTKTTLAQVGKEAGYTGGLVSHHFGSKEGLLNALVERITGRFFSDQLQPVTEQRRGVEALCAFVDTYLGEFVVREERVRTLYVLMGEALGPVSEINPVFAELNRAFRVTVRTWIEQGIDDETIRADVDADAEAALFTASIRGLAQQWMTDPGCFDLDATGSAFKNGLRRRLAMEHAR